MITAITKMLKSIHKKRKLSINTFSDFFKKRDILCIAMIIGTCVALLSAGFTSFALDCEKMPEEVLRLHIIANSDSTEDQNFKYGLRDFLLSDLNNIFYKAKSLEEAYSLAEENIELIKKRTKEYAALNDFPAYEINAELTEMYFTTRVYENMTMPAGNYKALRIVIGEGKGQNWWCVMFPPLCLPAVGEANEAYPAYFSKESSKAIESGKKGVEVRFAIFEWLESIFK